MTAPLWTSHDAAEATGGTNNADWSASGISIDTRTIQPGDLFVALQGPNFDGHDFAVEALKKGAAAVMVSRRIDTGGAQLLVGDTLQSLHDLAKFARARSQAKIIALTGSFGKTSVKEALAHLLALQKPTHASEASFNNHWGVPLSLALLPPQAHYAVFEMGMNHPGEIEPLSRLVRPHVALVNNVEIMHLGPVGSLEAIAGAKAEIFAGLPENGCAIINLGSNGLDILQRHAPKTHLTFGAPDADARIDDLKSDSDGSNVIATILGKRLAYRVPLPGAHQARNSLAVLLAIHALGADMQAAAEAYGTVPAVAGRGNRSLLALPQGDITLIDETHNAGPSSVRAALQALSLLQPAQDARKVAVLGDMLELGPESAQFHIDLAEDIIAAGIDLVFLSGPDMAHLHAALPTHLRGGHAADSTALLPIVIEALHDGDVVLVKGSRGSRMKVISEGVRGAHAV